MKIRAVYKNNVLKLLGKLNLKEDEGVEIDVRRSRKDFHGKIEIEKEIADEIIGMDIHYNSSRLAQLFSVSRI